MLAARLDAHEAWLLANATQFVACAFRGRGRYERAECASLDSARAEAREMLGEDPTLIGFELWDGPRQVAEERRRAGVSRP